MTTVETSAIVSALPVREQPLEVIARLVAARGLTTRRSRTRELIIALPRGGRPVTVADVQLHGERSIVAVAPICRELDADPRLVLRAVALMGPGALTLLPAGYAVRVVFQAARVEDIAVVRLIEYIGVLAYELGRVFTSHSAASVAGLFSHYVS